MICEVLHPGKSRKANRILDAMVFTAPKGVDCNLVAHASGKADWLMTYGLGHMGRRPQVDAHLRRGGRVIGWDLGYWDRGNAMRMTIDQDHPQDWIGKAGSGRTSPNLRSSYSASGPIILVGLGRKTRLQLGLNGLEWERRKLAEIRTAYPRATVVYRPKKMETLPGVQSSVGPIEGILKGASLVVCRHSNVAVDACIAGVPVVCEDGAAAWLYGNDLSNPVNPTPRQRQDFLTRLAWFNWHPAEAPSAWRFLKTVLG